MSSLRVQFVCPACRKRVNGPLGPYRLTYTKTIYLCVECRKRRRDLAIAGHDSDEIDHIMGTIDGVAVLQPLHLEA